MQFIYDYIHINSITTPTKGKTPKSVRFERDFFVNIQQLALPTMYSTTPMYAYAVSPYLEAPAVSCSTR